jgi:pimeloyl-ACP methyl ester carboxylesterase
MPWLMEIGMARFEAAVGRYVFVEVEGVEYRVYFEQAGRGIPLLLQHTAGSDGRQWRHLLECSAVTDHFCVIAPDLPYHGKSLPPPAVEWWKQKYQLHRDWFIDFLLTFSRALELEKPVFKGCSMGGQIAIDLALEHPDAFRAIIGLESALESQGAELPLLDHPRINNESKAALMYGLMAPTSPEAFRRETTWCYSQGAPPVFKGDLDYYALEYDLRGKARGIDPSRVPLYLFTGEYDWSVWPEKTEELVKEVPGARFQRMERMGHFPMSENPELFEQYLLPVLNEIASE